MFLSAYESIQACQLMEELFGRVKQGFWMITGLNFKWKHEHKQWRRGKQSEENSCSLLSHFWSTSRSSFSTCYIPFEILGSQESNASNRVRFGAEMRKIWPSEDNCIMSNGQFRNVNFTLRKFRKGIFFMVRNFAISQCAFYIAKFLWILCFSTHAPLTSQIFLAWFFSRVNSFCNLVFSRHKALSCNFAIYRGAQHLQQEGDDWGDRSSVH